MIQTKIVIDALHHHFYTAVVRELQLKRQKPSLSADIHFVREIHQITTVLSKMETLMTAIMLTILITVIWWWHQLGIHTIDSDDAENWQDAIDNQMRALQANDTFVVTDSPEGKQGVGERWVYSIKGDAGRLQGAMCREGV